MDIYEKIEYYKELISLLEEELEEAANQHYLRLSEIDDAWDNFKLIIHTSWLNIPTTEEIFNRRIIDNGDRFHHYDRNGYKRTRRVGRFDNNYHNAEIASRRQQNLDRIAQWAILDGIKQSTIDKFIEKYDLSSEEIERFENVMLETYRGICLGIRNIFNDSWYAAYNTRFDCHIPLV